MFKTIVSIAILAVVGVAAVETTLFLGLLDNLQSLLGCLMNGTCNSNS